MATVSKEDVQYKRIPSKRALRDLKLASPKVYDKVVKLREDHECLMNLPVEEIIPLMKIAVDGLIADGYCRRIKV